jgi:pantoate--beta-alanine ligase
VGEVSEGYCGAKRPGHFDGVATIITKLFNIVHPDNAYFGQKDYQQLLVIKKMVADLNFNINIIGLPIIREADGLAISSRNVFLKDGTRSSALSLFKSFEIVDNAIKNGKISPVELSDKIKKYILSFPGTSIDYVEFAEPTELTCISKLNPPFICLLAVKVGGIRLIDNKIFS